MRRTSLCSLLLLGLVCGERISTPLHAAEGFPTTLPARPYSPDPTDQLSIEDLKRLALAGDADAQVQLGVYYYDGTGVPKDYAEAVRWYRLAADQGYAKAQYNLGVCYFNGQGVPRDYAEAVRWCRLAANQGGLKRNII